jgi:anti-anti-sigma regulatory factor
MALCWKPEGNLAGEGLAILAEESKQRDGIEILLMDFAKIEELDAFGVGFLVALHKDLRSRGGELILFGMRPRHRRFIESLGFGAFFSIALDQRYAIEYILGVKRDVFPLAATCPVCSALLEVPKAGRSRCTACQAVLSAETDGRVELG